MHEKNNKMLEFYMIIGWQKNISPEFAGLGYVPPLPSRFYTYG